MSFVTETGDGGSVSSLSDTAHEVHSSRTSASSHQDVDLGEGSETESYVEVEQLGEDSAPGPAAFSNLTSGTSPALSPPCNTARHITKRTLITLHQRSVLEEYYRNGMTSASQQLTEVHEIVAEKTGLDLAVVRVSKTRRSHKCRPRHTRRACYGFAFFGFNVSCVFGNKISKFPRISRPTPTLRNLLLYKPHPHCRRYPKSAHALLKYHNSPFV